MKEKEIKLRYTPEQFKKVKEKAEKLNMSFNDYQKMISKKARIKIEVR